MSSDNQFTALGPAAIGFQTNGANINVGADIRGSEVGVRGHSDTNNGIEGESKHGIGVRGRGTAAGIVGEGIHNDTDLQHGGVGVKGTSFFDDGVVGISNVKGKSGVFGHNSQPNGTAFGVFGSCNALGGIGVAGESGPGVAVRGHSQMNDGVSGLSDAPGKSGVVGFNSKTEGLAFGVFGACNSAQGAGVSGRNDSTGDAVSGFSPKGVAVRGTSKTNDGVVGHSEARGKSGVYGENTNHPNPLVGVLGGPNEAFGVAGRANAAAGIGVFGASTDGCGVSGNGGIYGAKFQGGRAPLRLHPSDRIGAPASDYHLMGELYVDSGGNLFFCKVDGTPGTWVKLA